MRRHSFVRTLLVVGTLLVVVGVILGALVRHEPESYNAIQVPDANDRRQLAGTFTSDVQRLTDEIGSRSNEWAHAFTTEQMNSYFAEDFVRVKPFKLPEQLHSPRVHIEPGLFRLAFRLGQDFWSTVVTIDLNLWLVAQEPNMVAIEILRVTAGALPISAQSVLEQISENVRRFNADVNWYRRNGHPVAMLKFQPDRSNPTILLQQLELQHGSIVIAGRSTDAVPFKTFLSMTER